MDSSYSIFKKKKEQSLNKANRHKAEGARLPPKLIVGEGNLPHEIIVKIFEYLGALNVCRVSHTCRFWHESSADSGLWKYFCRSAVHQSLHDNVVLRANEPKDAIVQQYCEKQMKLLIRVKESSASAISTGYWREKYLNMLAEEVRILYSHKEVNISGPSHNDWITMPIQVLKYRPHKEVKKETFVPDSIYKVIALVNDETGARNFGGIFQTTDGYYLLLNCSDRIAIKHWDLETLLTGYVGQSLRQLWRLPTLKEFGKTWTEHRAMISIPAELRWYLIKAGLKLIKSCDECYNRSIAQTRVVLDEIDESASVCEVCSGAGDTWLFEAIEVPSGGTDSRGQKIDREVYSAQQILLRISTQWRKHKAQLIEQQWRALLSCSRKQYQSHAEDAAKQERKRKFDELVAGSDTCQDEISSKKVKFFHSEENEDLPTGGGWNTWLSKKGYGGIQNFMNWLNEKRPLPYLAHVLYYTEFAFGHHFLPRGWTALGAVRSTHVLVLNNELFAADQVTHGIIENYVDTHKTLPRGSIYSFGNMKLTRWKEAVLRGARYVPL